MTLVAEIEFNNNKKKIDRKDYYLPSVMHIKL